MLFSSSWSTLCSFCCFTEIKRTEPRKRPSMLSSRRMPKLKVPPPLRTIITYMNVSFQRHLQEHVQQCACTTRHGTKSAKSVQGNCQVVSALCMPMSHVHAVCSQSCLKGEVGIGREGMRGVRASPAQSAMQVLPRHLLTGQGRANKLPRPKCVPVQPMPMPATTISLPNWKVAGSWETSRQVTACQTSPARVQPTSYSTPPHHHVPPPPQRRIGTH